MTSRNAAQAAVLPDRAPAAPSASHRPLAHSAFHLVLGQVATTALAIVLTGLIGRSLGPADFGVWYLLTTVAGVAYVFVDWGYAPYVIREVARHPDRAGELTGTSLAIRLVATLLVCAPAVVSTWLLGYPAKTHGLTVLMLAAWLPMMLLTSFSWTFRGRERMDFEALVNVLMKVAALAATWLLLTLGGGLPGVIIAQGLAGALAFGWAMRLYKQLRVPGLQANLPTARELIREAAPIFTMGLMISLQPYLDANIMAKMVPSEVLGWYGGASAFSGTLLAPALILGGTLYPRLSQSADDPGELARLVRTGLRPMLFISVLGAIGTYQFAPFAVTLVYHKSDFAPAAAILQAFSPAVFLVSVDVLFGNVILATGKIKLFARAKIVAVVATTTLELFLIRICQTSFGNGGIGVMLSFAAGEIVLIVTALCIIPRGTLTGRSAADFARALLAGAGALLVDRLLGGVSPFLGIPFTVTTYAILSLAFGLVKLSDLDQLIVLVLRRRPVAVGPTAASLAHPS